MQAAGFFGHHLGLSTGDPVSSMCRSSAGMVFTVEPWYYNHGRGIAVFIEDVVVLTDGGAEVLTADPSRNPDDLERLPGTSA